MVEICCAANKTYKCATQRTPNSSTTAGNKKEKNAHCLAFFIALNEAILIINL